MQNSEQPHHTTEDFDAGLRSRLSRHIASHLKELGLMSIVYLEDGEVGSEASRVASDGANEITPLSAEEMEADHLQLDQEFWDYKAPGPVTPLDESLFELDWIRVKDLSNDLRTQDYVPEDLEKESITAISDILAVDPNRNDLPQRVDHILQLSRTKYEQFRKLEDLVHPTELLSKVLESISTTNPKYGHYAHELGLLCFHRALMGGGSISILDTAIRKVTLAVDSIAGGPERAGLFSILGDCFWLRSAKTQVQSKESVTDLDRAIDYVRMSLSETDTNDHSLCNRLCTLGVLLYNHSVSTQDFDESIKVMYEAMVLSGDSLPLTKASCLFHLSSSFAHRCVQRVSIFDFNEALEYASKAINATPDNHPFRPYYHYHLAQLHGLKYALWGSAEGQTMQFKGCQDALNDDAASPSLRVICVMSMLSIACSPGEWGIEKALLWETASDICIIQSWPLTGTDGELEITRFSASSRILSTALNLGMSAEDTVRLFELTRCDHFKSFRTRSGETFQELHPRLLEEFKSVLSKLDTTFAWHDFLPTENSSWLSKPVDGLDARYELNKITNIIRTMPGFEKFLLPSSGEELRTVASQGPIIVINADPSRCDAMIVQDHSISTLPLPKLTVDDILKQHSIRSSSTPGDHEETLLVWLWETICSPCLDELGFQSPAEYDHPHVWWILSGPLHGMPLHEAGVHEQELGCTVSDRVKSSYIHSIDALAQERLQIPQRKLGEGPFADAN